MSARRSLLRLSLALAAASASLSSLPACARPEVLPTEPPPPVEEEVDITEQIAVFAEPMVFPSLDPDLMLTSDCNIGLNAYETLTRWDPDEGVVPLLATSWESNEDSTEWTFYLREGVTFHDGTPFTAEAVKFSYERTIEMEMMAYYLDAVEEMQVIDDHTFRFLLNAPRPMDRVVSASYGMFIVNPNIAELPEGWFEEGNDAGTGPYMVDAYEPGVRVEIARYAEYWGGWEEGQFTRVVYEFVEDPTVREQMIRAGEANATRDLAWASYESLQALDTVRVETPPLFFNLYYMLNLSKPPLDDILVREALAYAFPYDDVQRGTYGGQATQAQGITPVGLWEPPTDWEPYRHNPERARELLEEVGYVDGMELRLAIRAGIEERKDIAQLFQAELANLGIDLRITEVAESVWWDIAYDPDTEYDILSNSWAAGYASPYEFTIMYHSTDTFAPFTGYANPEGDRLMIEALEAEAIGQQEEANRLFTEVERLLRDDAVAIPIFDFPILFAFRSDTVGFVSNPLYFDTIFWYEMRIE